MPQGDESVWGKTYWALHGTQEASSILLPQLCISKSTSSRRVKLQSHKAQHEARAGSQMHRPGRPQPTQEAAPHCRRFQGRHRGHHSPQKEMMWLLSSWTNFRVTASSMICFTCRMHRGWERLIRWGAVPQGPCCTSSLSTGCLGCLSNLFSFHSLLVSGRSEAQGCKLPISLHLHGGLPPFSDVTQSALPYPQFPELPLCDIQHRSFQGLGAIPALIPMVSYLHLLSRIQVPCLALCLIHTVY